MTPTLQADLQAESVDPNYKLNRLNGAIGSYTMQLEIATLLKLFTFISLQARLSHAFRSSIDFAP
ncbi:MAG: hypothetical protein F6K28_13645 [Microcoleus sp. SIO2G3]|nr:hypothetical protein [Microcoleus sp. SIO2G3]